MVLPGVLVMCYSLVLVGLHAVCVLRNYTEFYTFIIYAFISMHAIYQ